MNSWGSMRASLAMAFAMVVSGCAAHVPAKGTSMKAESASEVAAGYEELRERLVGGDSTVDIEQLRNAYVTTSYYAPYGGPVVDALKEINRMEREGNFKDCLNAVHRIEDEAFAMLNLHHHAWACALEVGDEADAARHEGMARAIFGAITAAGDGRNTDTAWRTLSAQELYLVLAIQGLQPKGQALMNANGKAFDVMTVVPVGSEEEEARYFDITRQMIYGMKFLDGLE